VAFAPGTAFGSIGEGWIRIALCGSQADLVEGLGRIPAREPAGTDGSTGPIAGEAGALA
jgi:aspartate aminotransferase